MLITSNHKRVVKVLNANKRCGSSLLCLMDHSRGQLIPYSQPDFSGEPFPNFLLNVCSLHLHFFQNHYVEVFTEQHSCFKSLECQHFRGHCSKE